MLRPRLAWLALLLTSCVPTPGPPYPAATGLISGKVVDPHGHAVAGANVSAIYYGAFVQLLQPAPNDLVAAQTTTARDGTFAIQTTKHIKQLAARTSDFKLSGELYGVAPSGNVIRIQRPWRGHRYTLKPGEKPPPSH